jgi:hypothetical protein
MALLPARSANSRYHAANLRSLSGSGAPIGLFMANVSPPPIRARTNPIRRGAAGKVMVNFKSLKESRASCDARPAKTGGNALSRWRGRGRVAKSEQAKGPRFPEEGQG